MDQYFTRIDPSIQWQVNEALRCENVVIVQWAIRASLSMRSLRSVLMACKFYAGDLAFFPLPQGKADLARQCGADCNLVFHSQATRTVTSGRESRR